MLHPVENMPKIIGHRFFA